MAGARDYNPPPPFLSSPTPFNHQIQESAAAKAYDAEWKWMSSTEAKQRSAVDIKEGFWHTFICPTFNRKFKRKIVISYF